MAFEDLDEFLDENLGYRTQETSELAALEKRAAKRTAFLARWNKWRKENPAIFRVYQKWWYQKKRQDPVWWAHRQETNRAYKQRIVRDEKYYAKRREEYKRYKEKLKLDPVRKAAARARDAAKLRKRRAAKRQQQLTLKFKKAA